MNKREVLDKELLDIVERTTEQSDMYERSRRYLYEALAGIYFWWRKANALKGYLQEKYAENGIQVNKSAEEKFTGVLRLTWRLDWGNSGRASLQQWSLVLREMHKEFESNRRAYKAKPVQNMANWISSQGGVGAITGVKSVIEKYLNSDGVAKNKSVAGKVKRDVDEEKIILQKHKENGEKYFDTAKPLAHVDDLPSDVAISDKGYAVALIRKSKGGKYNVLSTSNDSELVENLIAQTYDRNSAAIPYVLRTIVDVIKTQSLPVALNKHRYMLPDTTQFVGDDGAKHKHRQNKRLILRTDFADILLSENRTACSVVTVATPNVDFSVMSGDVYLNANDRRYIEEYIIQRNDLSLYDAVPDACLEVVKNEEYVATHKLKISNTILNKQRVLHFYPLSEAKHVAKQQADIGAINGVYDLSVVLDRFVIESICASFVSGWLRVYAPKIKQAKHQIIGLKFMPSKMCFTYFGEDGVHSQQSPNYTYSKVESSKSLSIKVLAKDILPLLDALPTYNMLGKVSLKVNRLVLHFSFDTPTAKFDVYVPTCTDKGKRNTSAFMKYEA